jgi:nitroreductase
MDAMDAIYCRRSIRKYTPQSVPEALVTELLKAAMAAPSAGNEQPWQFVVITDRALLDKIPAIHAHAQMCKEAALAVLVCLDRSLEKHEGMAVQDLSAATENLLIASCAQGLGSVWLGIYPREERVRGLRDLLGLPENVVPFSLVALGYPAEEKPPAERYDASRVHHNGW